MVCNEPNGFGNTRVASHHDFSIIQNQNWFGNPILAVFAQFSVSEVNFFKYKFHSLRYIMSEQGRSIRRGSFTRRRAL
jgi:membrane protein YdbS with pleckstrin-like domain